MNNFLNNITKTILLLIALSFTNNGYTQCTPPMAESCEESQVLCSLDEMNGYACNNPSTIASPCTELCSQGGVGHNTSWWGFVTQGGSVTVTLTIGGCTTNQGLQFGIWGDCVCGEEIACHSIPCAPPGSVNTIVGNLKPCKTYYLWVDGCSGDICDFTLNTGGGGSAPSLSPLGFINNESDGIIEPVCVGACDFRLFVNPQPGACEPIYIWQIDGNEIVGNSNEIEYYFPVEGDFMVCVTAYIGNPQGGSVCDQEGPKCATVKVRPIPDRTGLPRTICFDEARPSGYKWHTQRIFNSGVYREHITDANCCEYDSIVEFIVLPSPLKRDVYYITCNDEPYIDYLGREHSPCKDREEIILENTSQPYECDSVIILTAISAEAEPKWKVNCKGDLLEIAPDISIRKPCYVGESYLFEYRWYKKSDSTRQTISTDERILVNAVNEEYCLEVNVHVELDTQFLVCSQLFCKKIDEKDYKVNAGKDFKQKNLTAKLNADSPWPGIWSVLSGPGNVVFQNIKNTKSKIRVNDYGLYCFLWTVDDAGCDLQDTVCVEFYKIKVVDPESPDRKHDERASFSSDDAFSLNLYTPNLISGTGNTYVSFNEESDGKLAYTWYDVFGNVYANEQMQLEPGMQRMEIKSPVQSGLYFVVFEIDEVPFVKKVCVIE